MTWALLQAAPEASAALAADGTAIAVLVGVFVVLLALGVRVAFAIGLATVATMMLSIGPTAALTTVAQRMATGLDSFTLLAIPFFILAGQLMNQGGIAARLIDFAKALLGPLPGGLAFVNVLASMLFGAISGSAVAAASAIGATVGPRMVDEGYDRDFAAAVNITSATTGLIIPPSNVLIVYSLASGGASIAALFLAGYVPGLLVGGMLMAVAGVTAWRRGYPTGEWSAFGEIVRRFVAALPSLFLLVVVIGGIVGGVFTATEAAAVAVLYAGALAFAYRGITLRDLPQILLDATATTAIVLLLIAVSIAMSWIMAYVNLPQAIASAVTAVENPIAVFLIINVVLLFVGVFMDMTPAILIFTPIFLPVVVELGMDPVHFGIVMVLNLCIGLCTPPVGSVLFVGVGVAETTIARVVRPLLPLFIAMLIALALVTAFPGLSLWLPSLLGY
ncbi:TRAP transporter large permease [Rubrivirga litoralis]|uniref:TRAP transporter large permease n=1 Tax=Rubrivirga litoralis TaxID=3075598 RepID=A0ABU3BNL9_9BACT|nr:TRAP transporter large permease [Rubrivirga sp. F394]MDT0630902.1 TRAP transporter large permease [Rubrivirga sp. F394]